MADSAIGDLTANEDFEYRWLLLTESLSVEDEGRLFELMEKRQGALGK